MGSARFENTAFVTMIGKTAAGATGVTLLLLLAVPAAAQALRGSPASVDRIHSQALGHGLRFYPSASAIRDAHQRGDLVRLDGDANYGLSNVSYPYVVPAVHTFVVRLAAQYRQACGERLVVTSAARPTSMRLANSVAKSVHPTGMAIDLRKPASPRCLSWLRNTLLSLEAGGVLEAVEERNPPHFHVAVFPTPYSRYVQGRSSTVQLVSAAPVLMQAGTSASGSDRTYQVRRGDSLWTIARRNNVTVDDLKAANALRTSRILAGQVLLIPEAR